MMKMTKFQKLLVEENIQLIDRVIRNHIGMTSDPMYSYDDFYQVGAEALCRAAMTYRQVCGPFEPYGQRVIYNALIDYCRHMRFRYIHQTSACWDVEAGDFSLILKSEESEKVLLEVDSADTMRIFQERKAQYKGVAKAGLEALELKMAGYTTAEIAKMYNSTVNNVNAWISRARQKLMADEEFMAHAI